MTHIMRIALILLTITAMGCRTRPPPYVPACPGCQLIHR